MSFKDQVQAFLADAADKAKGGLTLAEIGALFISLIYMAVALLNSVSVPGADKKALVLEAVGFLFDTIAPAIPLPFWLAPVRLFLRPRLRQLVLAIADGAIEAIYARLKPLAV